MEREIFRLLSAGPMSGDALREALGADEAAFKAAARGLWIEGLIQGVLSDGCCSAPCGTMCVAAMKFGMDWQLSKKGRLRLKVLAARGEGI